SQRGSRLSRGFLQSAAGLHQKCGRAILVPAMTFLESATPAEVSTLQTPPKELRLSFTEPIEVAFSRVTVTGPNGQNVAQPIVQTGITRSITEPLSGELPPGEYTVQWLVLSIDTHTTN